jgi:hypothetical protein
MAPMAVTSDGAILVNAYQLSTKDGLAAAIDAARATGLTLFIGVAIPGRLRGHVLHDVDDALADVVGRLGTKLTAKVSVRSSGERAARRPGRPARRAPRPRGRRP